MKKVETNYIKNIKKIGTVLVGFNRGNFAEDQSNGKVGKYEF